MKVSLITTIFNEEENVRTFFDSFLIQTKKPDELIIVDGGSSDNTLELINNAVEGLPQNAKKKTKIRVISKTGLNRSEGRNFAIKIAEGEVIAVSDFGCVLDKKWLRNITQPFSSEKTMAVSGYYLPLARTIFEKSVAAFFCVMPDVVEKRMKERNFEFLPSSRSVAFRKKVWNKVKGYPEKLNYCEDLVFDQKIKKAGINFQFVKEAIVYWPQRDSLKKVFKQFFNYAVGDGMVFFSPYQTHSKKILFLFARYFFGFFLLILGLFFNAIIKLIFLIVFIYLFRELINKYKYVKHPLAIIYLPLIKITGDLAVMLGSIKGLIQAD